MNCRERHKEISEALDGQLDQATRVELDAHLEVCSACQETAAQLKGTWDLLLEYPEIPPSPHFLARVKSRLGIPFGWKAVGGLLATAAAVLLAFVFILRPNATDSPGVDPTALVTAEERELLEYLDVAENYDVVQALEVLIDKAETEGGQIFFPSGGEEK